jgi:adenylate cyclase
MLQQEALVMVATTVRDEFHRYLSPQLVERIFSDPRLRKSAFKSTKARVPAAVLAADLRGFSAISERFRPVEVVELLNQFFTLLAEVAFEHDGAVFPMGADSLMVGFGVPVEQIDRAERAFLAARAMLDRFGALAERWETKYFSEVGLGVGINAGDVIVGVMGPRARSFTLIGDAVSVARRVGLRARAGELVLSESVKYVLDNRGIDVKTTRLPTINLASGQPMDIFCVPAGRRIDFRMH